MKKMDLHIHTKSDPFDTFINYSNTDILELALSKGFSIISITLHNKYFFDKKLFLQYLDKGLLIIPGVELTINHKEKSFHVLIYSHKNIDVSRIKTINDLYRLRHSLKEKVLIGLPHPFYPYLFSRSIGKLAFNITDLFDFFEYSSIYCCINYWNNKALRIAKKLKKTVIGNSDLHFIDQFNHTFTLIPFKEFSSFNSSIHEVFSIIRENNVKISSRPLSPFILSRFFLKSLKN